MATKRFYLREWRKARGLTQEALAEAAETSKGYISDLERGNSPYNQTWLETFGAILQIAPAALLSPPPAGMESRGRAYGEPAGHGRPGHDDDVDEGLLRDCVRNALRIVLRRRPLTSPELIDKAAEDAALAAIDAYATYHRLRAEEDAA